MRKRAATNSLERALLVLEIVERTPGGLRHSDLVQRLSIPGSTCTYITARLERKGYLVRDAETGRFKVGLTTVALAHGALREIGVRSIAEPTLYRLTAETGLSAGVGVLDRGKVLIIDRVEGPNFVREEAEMAKAPPRIVGMRAPRSRALRDVGRELPAHSTALGKVLLAWLTPQELLAVIAANGLARRTSRTIDSEARLLAEIAEVRRQGFATADEEAYVGVRALSAPIVGAGGEVRAALSVNGNPREAIWKDLPELVRLVKDAAREISRRV
jgi:IclR family transcriptional regulator, acetate operon repressor